MDSTASDLAWLARTGVPARRLEPLAGDVSPRRYFRAALIAGGSAILAVYPDSERAACRRFLATGKLLAGAGVRVPRVLAADCAAGRMLLEDLGRTTLFEARDLAPETLESYFAAALRQLEAIQRLPLAEVGLLSPPLDGPLLRRELEQTRRLVLEPRGLVRGRERRALESCFDALCSRLGGEPPRPCHRDFMVRNLVPAGPPPGLAVIDHQDLRPGPPLYDLASLFNDSLFLPPSVEERLLAPRLPGADCRESFHRAAAQRSLKAVGTYAAFARRGARRHLPLVAPTLARAVTHLSRLPEAADVARALARRLGERPAADDLLE